MARGTTEEHLESRERSVQDNLALMRWYFDLLNTKDLDAMLELVDDEIELTSRRHEPFGQVGNDAVGVPARREQLLSSGDDLGEVEMKLRATSSSLRTSSSAIVSARLSCAGHSRRSRSALPCAISSLSGALAGSCSRNSRAWVMDP